MKYRVRIVRDEDPFSPREWDNVGVMACWHRRHRLGDEQVDTDNYRSAEEYVETEIPKGSVILPLYLYEHGGITTSTGPFTDHFDRWQVGIIYATPDAIRKSNGIEEKQPITDDLRTSVEEQMKAEVNVYDDYIQGDVWSFIVESVHECESCSHVRYEHEESCGGFFGSDLHKSGIVDHINDLDLGIPEEKIMQAWEDRT